MSVYSAKDLSTTFKIISKRFSPTKTSFLAHIPPGFAIAFPVECVEYFDPDPMITDYKVEIKNWDYIKSKMKLQENIVYTHHTNNNQKIEHVLTPDKFLTQQIKKYYFVERIAVHDSIPSKFESSPNDDYVNTILGIKGNLTSLAPVFLISLPEKHLSLNLKINRNALCFSYSNIQTNIKCMQNLCELFYIALNRDAITLFKNKYELQYADNALYFNYSQEFLKEADTMKEKEFINIYQYLRLYISMPVTLASIVKSDDSVLQIDPNNSNNFLYQIPTSQNKFEFLYHKMPLRVKNINPPFLLLLKNSYNQHNVNFNGKKFTCLGTLIETENSNKFKFTETFESEFNPIPNNNLQFVLTDLHENRSIKLDSTSSLLVSVFDSL